MTKRQALDKAIAKSCKVSFTATEVPVKLKKAGVI